MEPNRQCLCVLTDTLSYLIPCSGMNIAAVGGSIPRACTWMRGAQASKEACAVASNTLAAGLAGSTICTSTDICSAIHPDVSTFALQYDSQAHVRAVEESMYNCCCYCPRGVSIHRHVSSPPGRSAEAAMQAGP